MNTPADKETVRRIKAHLLRATGSKPSDVKFVWRKDEDVSMFLKQFDRVQKRTAKSKQQLS